ncbi:MAG: 50S ribosomal protein L22 [Planctomycetes bacterium]|nr:50S ribosomal protein L22 [Planctomycetota bacterium]
MAYQSCHRYARIAPRKARLVADMIRGKPVDQALTALDFSTKRGASFLRYVLRAAIAQAELASVDPGRLFVSESRVDEGPTLKRFQEKDRGRSHQILKRTCHLHVAVDAR